MYVSRPTACNILDTRFKYLDIYDDNINTIVVPVNAATVRGINGSIWLQHKSSRQSCEMAIVVAVHERNTHNLGISTSF